MVIFTSVTGFIIGVWFSHVVAIISIGSHWAVVATGAVAIVTSASAICIPVSVLPLHFHRLLYATLELLCRASEYLNVSCVWESMNSWIRSRAKDESISKQVSKKTILTFVMVAVEKTLVWFCLPIPKLNKLVPHFRSDFRKKLILSNQLTTTSEFICHSRRINSQEGKVADR